MKGSANAVVTRTPAPLPGRVSFLFQYPGFAIAHPGLLSAAPPALDALQAPGIRRSGSPVSVGALEQIIGGIQSPEGAEET